MADAPNPPASALPEIDHVSIREQINNCSTIQGFLDLYDTQIFGRCTRLLRVSQGDEDVTDWARNWAIAMREPEPAALALNECRNTLLLLIFTLMDRWRDESVTANDIVERFQGHRVNNILQLALPMDRAHCLFTMQYPNLGRHGMHWTSAQQVAHSPEWQATLRNLGGGPTMDERYLWLIEEPFLALQLRGDQHIIMHLLDPQYNHHLDEDDEEMEE